MSEKIRIRARKSNPTIHLEIHGGPPGNHVAIFDIESFELQQELLDVMAKSFQRDTWRTQTAYRARIGANTEKKPDV